MISGSGLKLILSFADDGNAFNKNSEIRSWGHNLIASGRFCSRESGSVLGRVSPGGFSKTNSYAATWPLICSKMLLV